MSWRGTRNLSLAYSAITLKEYQSPGSRTETLFNQ